VRGIVANVHWLWNFKMFFVAGSNTSRMETMAEEDKKAPMHGDILEAILSHTPACHVPITWKSAILSSLGRFNKIKPWLIIMFCFLNLKHMIFSCKCHLLAHAPTNKLRCMSSFYVLLARTRSYCRTQLKFVEDEAKDLSFR
jgi:hypothetical protein